MSNFTELLQQHHSHLYNTLKNTLAVLPGSIKPIPELPCLNPDLDSGNDRIVIEGIALAPAGIFYALGETSFSLDSYEEERAQANISTHDMTPAIYGFEYADPTIGGQVYLLDANLLKSQMELEVENESDYGTSLSAVRYNDDIYMFYANVLDALLA